MKLYIHGPREGQTIKLNGVQFVNGVAEYPILLHNLKKYYNVKDYPPEEADVSINNGQSVELNKKEQEIMHESLIESVEVIDSGEEILNKIVEEKKAELSKEKPSVQDWKAMPWWTAKAYVKEKTGKSPKDKKSAMAIMKEAGFE